MPRLHFVKKARKAIKDEGIEKGDSYYWWKFRFGGKHVSKSQPRRSQLTQSEFLSSIYDLEDSFQSSLNDVEGAEDESVVDDFRSMADEIRSLGDEQSDKARNMESAFPGGNPTIDLLNERQEACESIASEIESACDSVDTEQDDWQESFKQELEGVGWSYN